MTLIIPMKSERNILDSSTKFVSTSIQLCQRLKQGNVVMIKASQTHQVPVYTSVPRMSTMRMNHASHVRIPVHMVVYDQVIAETV